jgi:hypothetical protein
MHKIISDMMPDPLVNLNWTLELPLDSFNAVLYLQQQLQQQLSIARHSSI